MDSDDKNDSEYKENDVDEQLQAVLKSSQIKGYDDSIHSGLRLKSTKISMKLWSENNKGYAYGHNELSRIDEYNLALEYIKEKQFISYDKYSMSDNCYYYNNHCHIETRNGHRYLRPSNCSKFVLEQGKKHFTDYSLQYSYHGTHPNNIQSILKYGLSPSGARLDNGVTVAENNGAAFGKGVYTSKMPLYAQLYAPCEKWKNKYVQTILLVRQNPKSILEYGAEGKATKNMIGRDDIHLLYGDLIKEEETQFKTEEYKTIVIQALLIKIHVQDPSTQGGEYFAVAELLNQIKNLK